jgi:hypothetical protein
MEDRADFVWNPTAKVLSIMGLALKLTSLSHCREFYERTIMEANLPRIGPNLANTIPFGPQ